METSPAKRRKLDHQSSSGGPPSNGAAALGAAATAGTSRPSTFVLQAQELLSESRIDYEKAFSGADALCHRIKSTIEAIEPQSPTPVSIWTTTSFRVLGKMSTLILTFSRIADSPSILRAREDTWNSCPLPRTNAPTRISLQSRLCKAHAVQCCWQLCLQDDG